MNTLDVQATQYITELYFEGHDVSKARTFLAALPWAYPMARNRHGQSRLTRAPGACQGWKRLAPPGSRNPLPEVVISMVVSEIYRELGGGLKGRRAAIGLMSGYRGYFRQGELCGLQIRHINPPSAEGGAETRFTSIGLHPTEDGVPSKVGVYDTTIAFDKERDAEIAAGLCFLHGHCNQNESILGLSQEALGRVWSRVVVRLKLQKLGPPVPYQLRHSGASSDRSSETRTQAEVMKRGRWASLQSVARYEKAGKISEQFRKLSKKQKEFAALRHNQMGLLLRGAIMPPVPDF